MDIQVINNNYNLENIEGEEWRSCSGFDGYYEVSSLGRVKSLGRYVNGSRGSFYLIKTKILKAALKGKDKKCKYYFVVLRINNKGYTKEVHKLVANEFVEGDKALMVLHKNNNTLDNRAVNLRFGTVYEKAQIAWNKGNRTSALKGKFGGDGLNAKGIEMCSMDGSKIKSFTSRIEAAEWLIKTGIARKQPKRNIMSALNKVAKGVKYVKSAHGFLWKNVA